MDACQHNMVKVKAQSERAANAGLANAVSARMMQSTNNKHLPQTYQGRQLVLSLLSTSRPAVQIRQVGLQVNWESNVSMIHMQLACVCQREVKLHTISRQRRLPCASRVPCCKPCGEYTLCCQLVGMCCLCMESIHHCRAMCPQSCLENSLAGRAGILTYLRRHQWQFHCSSSVQC